jgi:Protein of unknown function (DUF2934)
MATQSNVRPKGTRKGTVSLLAAPKPAAAGDAARPDPVDVLFRNQEIARLAYSYWQARGFAGGSPEEDWYRAEAEFQKRAG